MYKEKIIKCSSERKIALSSNFNKFMDTFYNKRVQKGINMRFFQVEGQYGCATMEHIYIQTIQAP